MSIHGIDVSAYQGTVRWNRVKKDGIQFAMLRAGYGDGTIDKEFRRNAEECNKEKIPFGVYWFSYAYSKEMARREAEHCIRTIKDYHVHYPVCIDFEEASVQYAEKQGVKITKKLATEIVEAFCDRVEELGYFAMYYSNRSYLEEMFSSKLRNKYALWYAQYAARPSITGMEIWQYRSNGRVDGITGDVDMNIAYHDLARAISRKKLNKQEKEVSTPDSAKAEPNDIIKYIVRSGDTLSEIAAHYGTTYQRLASYNQIENPNKIHVGQIIDIPIGENSSKYRYYTIKPGDTLSEIAEKYNTTVRKLQEMNSIKNANKIYPGQIILV